ncbi:sigma-70 family RNA polymerase sigma factor [Agromyces soli]
MSPVRSDVSDIDLVERTRQGDADAYAELWRRHAASGRTVARSYSSLDPDDLVAESFTKIYDAILAGGGPRGAFRPYLFTTLRNTAAGWGRARHETNLETLESFEDPHSSEQASLDALDRGTTAQAFRSLPTRWQEVLWYSEVEQMTPQQIAPLVGMSANATAALAYRAREGLRQAWIRAHLKSTTEPDCQWTIDHLGAYSRSKLGKRDTTRLEAHLDDCAKCTIVAAEAREVGSRLALVLLPLAAGIGGATAYTARLQAGAPVTDVAMGAGGVGLAAAGAASASAGGAGGSAAAGGAGAGAGAGGAGGAGAGAAGATAGASAASGIGATGVAIGVGAGALALAAAAVAAAVVLPSLGAGAPDAPPAAEAAVDAPIAAPGADATTVPSLPPIASPVPSPTAPPLAPSDPPSDAPSPDSPPAPIAAKPEPTAPPTSMPGPNPTPTPTATPTPTPTPTPGPDTEALPPAVFSPDTGGGILYPVLSGTAEPGATITVSNPSPSPALLTSLPTTVAADDGSWSLTVDSLPAGRSTLAVVQRDVAGNLSQPTAVEVDLRVPYGEVTLIPSRFEIWGVPHADVLVDVDGERFGVYRLDGRGYARESNDFDLLFGAAITIRYGAGDRVGPPVDVESWLALSSS